MLKMPQIMHPNPSDSKALRQMRADRFYALVQAGAELEQRRAMGGSHPFPRSGHDEDSMSLCQHGLPKSIN
jgi:hypothetical protein